MKPECSGNDRNSIKSDTSFFKNENKEITGSKTGENDELNGFSSEILCKIDKFYEARSLFLYEDIHESATGFETCLSRVPSDLKDTVNGACSYDESALHSNEKDTDESKSSINSQKLYSSLKRYYNFDSSPPTANPAKNSVKKKSTNNNVPCDNVSVSKNSSTKIDQTIQHSSTDPFQLPILSKFQRTTIDFENFLLLNGIIATRHSVNNSASSSEISADSFVSLQLEKIPNLKNTARKYLPLPKKKDGNDSKKIVQIKSQSFPGSNDLFKSNAIKESGSPIHQENSGCERIRKTVIPIPPNGGEKSLDVLEDTSLKRNPKFNSTHSVLQDKADIKQIRNCYVSLTDILSDNADLKKKLKDQSNILYLNKASGSISLCYTSDENTSLKNNRSKGKSFRTTGNKQNVSKGDDMTLNATPSEIESENTEILQTVSNKVVSSNSLKESTILENLTKNERKVASNHKAVDDSLVPVNNAQIIRKSPRKSKKFFNEDIVNKNRHITESSSLNQFANCSLIKNDMKNLKRNNARKEATKAIVQSAANSMKSAKNENDSQTSEHISEQKVKRTPSKSTKLSNEMTMNKNGLVEKPFLNQLENYSVSTEKENLKRKSIRKEDTSPIVAICVADSLKSTKNETDFYEEKNSINNKGPDIKKASSKPKKSINKDSLNENSFVKNKASYLNEVGKSPIKVWRSGSKSTSLQETKANQTKQNLKLNATEGKSSPINSVAASVNSNAESSMSSASGQNMLSLFSRIEKRSTSDTTCGSQHSILAKLFNNGSNFRHNASDILVKTSVTEKKSEIRYQKPPTILNLLNACKTDQGNVKTMATNKELVKCTSQSKSSRSQVSKPPVEASPSLEFTISKNRKGRKKSTQELTGIEKTSKIKSDSAVLPPNFCDLIDKSDPCSRIQVTNVKSLANLNNSPQKNTRKKILFNQKKNSKRLSNSSVTEFEVPKSSSLLNKSQGLEENIRSAKQKYHRTHASDEPIQSDNSFICDPSTSCSQLNSSHYDSTVETPFKEKRKRHNTAVDPNFEYAFTPKRRKVSKKQALKLSKNKNVDSYVQCVESIDKSVSQEETYENVCQKNTNKSAIQISNNNSNAYVLGQNSNAMNGNTSNSQNKVQYVYYPINPECQILYNPENNTRILAVPLGCPLTAPSQMPPIPYQVGNPQLPFNQYIPMPKHIVSQPLMAPNQTSLVPVQNFHSAVMPSISSLTSTTNMQPAFTQQNIPIVSNANDQPSVMQQAAASAYTPQNSGHMSRSFSGLAPSSQHTNPPPGKSSMLLFSKTKTTSRPALPTEMKNYKVAENSVSIEFDWSLIMRRRTEMDTDAIIEIAADFYKGKYFDYTVRQFCTDSVLVAGLSKHQADFDNGANTCRIQYNFDTLTLNEPFLQVLKDFVHFYMRHIDFKMKRKAKASDLKNAFFQQMYSKFPVLFPILFSKVLTLDPKDITINDLISALTICGILIIFFECRKRL